MATFPHSLCGIRQDGHGEQHMPMVLRSDMERGIPKQRRAGADVLVRVPCSLVFRSAADAAAFEAWFYADGMGWFDFTLPRTGAVVQARIIGGDIGTLSPLTPAWNASERSVVLEYVRPAFVTLAPGLYDVDSSRILSVQRNSTATYIDSSGVLQTAPANTARYQGGQLLVEGEGTNLLLRSAEFEQAYWLKSFCAITSNAGASPSGSMDADLFIGQAGATSPSIGAAFTASAGSRYCASVFAKPSGYSFLLLAFTTEAFPDASRVAVFDIASGSVSSATQAGVSASVQPVGSGWFRCVISVVADASTVSSFAVGARPNNAITGSSQDGVSGVLLWGGQVEASESATSYIPTTTAAATRAADIITVAA